MKRSFQFFLTASIAVVSALIFAALAAAAWWLIWKQFVVSIDARLLTNIERTYPHTGDDPATFASDAERHWSRLFNENDAKNWALVIQNGAGEQVFASENAAWVTGDALAPFRPREFPDQTRPGGKGGKGPFGGPGRPFAPRPAPPAFFSLKDDRGETWRFVVMGGSKATVFSGKKLNAYHQELAFAERILAAGSLFGLMLIGIGSWLAGKLAITPLKRITTTASHITASGLDERIPETETRFLEFQNLASVLNQMMERLERSFRQASRFTADASHELKTPIALMQAEVDDALRHCQPGSEEEVAMLNVAREVQRLKRITQSLLLLSRADAGHLKFEAKPVSLSQEINGLCEDAELLCQDAALTLKYEVEPNLWVQGERTLISQAAQNILQNAVKYNEEGGWIECVLKKSGDSAILRITNTGRGISETDAERIFDRFFRIDPSRSRKTDGFGLGLNLALEIMKMHRGRLELVASSPQKTTFQLVWPLSDAPAGENG